MKSTSFLRHLFENTRSCGCGSNTIHRNIVVSNFLAPSFCKGDHAGLGIAVSRSICVSLFAGDRCNIYDPPIVLLNHVWENGTTGKK